MTSTSQRVQERAALRALEERRRERRGAKRDFWDRAEYVSFGFIFGLVFAAVIQTGTHPAPASPAVLGWLRLHAAAAIGVCVLVAAVEAIALGRRGGPLLVEEASVQHVLLAPLPRSIGLRRALSRAVTRSCLAALVAGVLAGSFVAPLVGRPVIAWIAFAVIFLVASVLLVIGVSLIVAGRRRVRSLAAVVIAATAALATIDFAFHTPLAPSTWFGLLAFAPLLRSFAAAAAIVLGCGTLAFGVRAAPAISVEAIASRGARVRQLRFAASTFDVLSWSIVRRRSQGSPRSRARFVLRKRPRDPVLRRCLRGISRWRTGRIFGLVMASLVSAGLTYVASLGSLPGTIAAALALFWLGLDTADPYAEAIEKRDLLRSVPEGRGLIESKHLIVPIVVVMIVFVPAALVVLVASHHVVLALLVLVGASLSAPASAAFVLGRRWELSNASGSRGMPPEAYMLLSIQRLVWPLIFPMLALAPVLALHRKLLGFPAGAATASGFAITAIVVSVVGLGGVGLRHAVRRWARGIGLSSFVGEDD